MHEAEFITFYPLTTRNRLGGELITPPRFFRNISWTLANIDMKLGMSKFQFLDINSTSFGVKKLDLGKTKIRYSLFGDVTSRDFGAKKEKCLKIRQKYVCKANCKKTLHNMLL